ncbi:outer membrane lipoprotein chaperone LolA [Duganella levis]|uniref:Outer-membrane lipoprotein carrier protein n=1 Tax=Duganella levis TaxID=2692169 RepID=A0ABW9W144_9BURK|nr:outer membrane lipoprotein chaperone LolA [Duganella levis]MYN27450.1 outer membrane lipoprotein chaperone LolA [Duganella levis]
MKRFKSMAVLTAGLLLAGAASVVNASALEQFKSFVSSTKAAKGEFVQTQVKGTNGDTPKANKNSSGTFVFARPGKFIWTYSKPYEQVLQADGDQMFIYDKDLNQVTTKKLGDALGSSPAAILFGSNDLEKNFTLSEGGTRDGLEWLKAVPKAKDTSFEQITIGLKDGLPAAMELKDSFGQTSVLKFSKIEKNPALSATSFKFVMPKGADVFNN